MAGIGGLGAGGVYAPTRWTLAFRFLAWSSVATLFAFLLNVYLSFWQDWPGAATAFGDAATGLSWAQVLIAWGPRLHGKSRWGRLGSIGYGPRKLG